MCNTEIAKRNTHQNPLRNTFMISTQEQMKYALATAQTNNFNCIAIKDKDNRYPIVIVCAEFYYMIEKDVKPLLSSSVEIHDIDVFQNEKGLLEICVYEKDFNFFHPKQYEISNLILMSEKEYVQMESENFIYG